MKKKVLLFSPYQAIPDHTFIEKRVVDILQDEGEFDLDVVICNEELKDHCTAMSSHGIRFLATPQEKALICKKCRCYASSVYRGFTGDIYSLKNFMSPDVSEEIRREIDSIKLDPSSYSFQGYNLGRISSYELILGHKLKNLSDITDEVRDEYIVAIRNNLKVLLLMRKILSQKEYDSVIFYNGNYVVNNTVVNLIRKEFVSTQPVLIHYGLNWAILRDKIFLIKDRHQEHLRDRIDFFEKNYSNIDFSKFDRQELETYIEALFSAKSVFVFSAAKSNSVENVFSKIGLSSKKPTALLSMASTDEIFALEFAVFQTELNWVEKTFKDQKEWIEHTVELFRHHPEWQLIIRIHPREFPNKRDKVLSKSVAYYLDLQTRLPPNVVMNFPDQNVSIYDLFEVIQLHLTSWSSVGMESSLLGIPTISSTRGIGLYPCKYVHFFTENPGIYDVEITRVMSGPFTRDVLQIERAKKWLLYEFNTTVIRYTTGDFWTKKPAFLKRAINKLLFPVAVFSYKLYKRKLVISENEKRYLVEFFKTKRDVFEMKTEDV